MECAACNSSSKTRPAMLVAGICIFLHRRLPVGLIERYAKEGRERERERTFFLFDDAYLRIHSSPDDFYFFFFSFLSLWPFLRCCLSFWVEQVNQRPSEREQMAPSKYTPALLNCLDFFFTNSHYFRHTTDGTDSSPNDSGE